MDLVGYDQAVFEEIAAEFTAFAAKLDIGDLSFVPISALHGDNVVQRSENMAWHDGPPLLSHLEHVHIASDRNLIDVRFPVQYVIRPHQATHPELHDYRGYAGQVAGGVLKPGDEVMHLPSGMTTRISRIDTARGEVPEAFPPMSVTLVLEDDLDISRGDLICRPHNQPMVTQDIETMVCWMSDSVALTPRSRLVDQAHHPHGEGPGARHALPAGREHSAPGGEHRPARPERDRPRHPPPDAAAVLRPLQPEPADRRADPHRRGHQRHGRRRHDHRRALDRPLWTPHDPRRLMAVGPISADASAIRANQHPASSVLLHVVSWPLLRQAGSGGKSCSVFRVPALGCRPPLSLRSRWRPAGFTSAAGPPSRRSPSFVQQVSAHKGNVASLAVTPGSAVTAGDRLVVEVGVWNSSGATAGSVTDSAGNTYTELAHFKASDKTELSVWSAPVTSGGGTRPVITVKPTSAADVGVAALEYSGVSAAGDSSVVDVSSHASGTTSTAATVGSGATAVTAGG